MVTVYCANPQHPDRVVAIKTPQGAPSEMNPSYCNDCQKARDSVLDAFNHLISVAGEIHGPAEVEKIARVMIALGYA